MGGQTIKSGLEIMLLAPREKGEGKETPAPKRVPMAIQQYRAKPGKKLATSVIISQALPRLDQRVLGKVLGHRRVAAESDGLAQQPRLVNPANLAEGLGIARASALEKIPRVWEEGFHVGDAQAEHV
jgi:hypothetical protein